MADQPSHPESVEDPDLWPSLVEALGGLHRHAVDVPASLDESILRDARAGYRRRRRFWLLAKAGIGAAATAAAVAIAVMVYTGRDRRAPAPLVVNQDLRAEDIDRNGRVDILDAFLLAKKVDAKSPAGQADDLNGDGRVDRGDVDLVAALAVAVGKQEKL